MNKKRSFIALLLALTTMASLAVTSFAEGNDINDGKSTEIVARVDEKKIILGEDEVNSVSTESVLSPDSVFVFPIYILDGKDKTKLTQDDMDSMDISIEKTSSTGGVKSVKLVEIGGVYSLRVETQKHWNTANSKSNYTVNLKNKKTGETLYTSSIDFSVGCMEIADSSLNGKAIVIENSRPIIKSEQFAKINSLSGGKAVTFSAGNWKFEVKTANQNGVNMTYNANVSKLISEKFPENKFKFVNFPASPNFAQDGIFTIDVSDKADTFENMFVYRYLDGVIYKINAKHDTEKNTLSFATKKLGTFFVTDKEIEDKLALGNETGIIETDDKGNPTTGSQAITAAVAAAVASGAVIVFNKKRLG